MIVIFVLLGLALLLGGVGAIVDGWPYLVLERGFTQVIIGTVAATAGLILLALSWVLVELRRVRTSLNAMSLLSVATALPPEPRAPVAVAEREPVLPETIMPAPTVPVPESRLPGLGTVAAGAGLAAAGGALASVFSDRGIGVQREPIAEERQEPVQGPVHEPAQAEHPEIARDEAEPPRPEPTQADIFDEALVDVAATREAGDEAVATVSEEADEPAQAAAEEQAALFEDRDEALADGDAGADEAPSERREDEASVAPEEGPEQAGEPEPEPITAPEPPAAQEPKRSWWPRFGSRAQEPERPQATEADDLTALRQHLTLGPQPPAKSAETDETAGDDTRGDDIRAAESWMLPGRREPSFDAPAPEEAEKPADYVEPGIGAGSEPVAEEPTAEAFGEEAAAEGGEEVPAEEAPAEALGPAASDEGVIGAYQVGDTHFTMYADGSIRARTPDGEYSFASMDELRAYLASEKSKLGS